MKENFSILYAEDDILTRKNFILHLTNHFDQVYDVADGKEALRAYREKKPDVLLVDVEMPHMNGFELIRTIRETDTTTPIIILSGHSSKEYLFEAVKLNLVDYLVKPINMEKFKSVINLTLNNISNNQNNNKEDRIQISKNCFWDIKKRIVFHKSKIIEFTKNERMLFELLLSKKNELVQPNDIAFYIWNNKDVNINDASIRNLVKRVRKKLPVDIVRSIYGSGYIMNF